MCVGMMKLSSLGARGEGQSPSYFCRTVTVTMTRRNSVRASGANHYRNMEKGPNPFESYNKRSISVSSLRGCVSAEVNPQRVYIFIMTLVLERLHTVNQYFALLNRFRRSEIWLDSKRYH